MRSCVVTITLAACLCIASAAEDGMTTSRANEGNVSSRLLSAFRSIKRRMRDTAARIFGTEPQEDGSFEFELPVAFRDITMEQFATWYNGELEDPEDSHTTLDDGSRSEGEILELIQQQEGVDAGADADLAASLPAKFDFYAKYPRCLTEAYDQSQCGSCYAFAVATALTTRLCKAIVDAGDRQFPYRGYRLSPQPIVSCGGGKVCPSGNCCKGGYTARATQWVKDQNLYPMGCYEYESWHGDPETGRCEKEKEDCAGHSSHKKSKKKTLWGARKDPMFALKPTVKSYTYVPSSVAKIQKEIMENGPITSKIKTASNLIGYNGKGVFSRGDAPWLAQGETHSYHAWVIHGWDEEAWLVTNSWGETYYKRPKKLRHTIRVKKGSNELQIESQTKIAMVPGIRTEDGTVKSIAEGWPAKGTYDISNLAVSESESSDNNTDDDEDEEHSALSPELMAETQKVIAETKAYLHEQGVGDIADRK